MTYGAARTRAVRRFDEARRKLGDNHPATHAAAGRMVALWPGFKLDPRHESPARVRATMRARGAAGLDNRHARHHKRATP